MSDSPSIRQQLEWARGVLNNISASARLDSEVLLAHCLGKDRSYLLTWPEQELTPEQLEYFQQLVGQRSQAQPVAYLVGHREFYSLDFITTPDTLVPRPETEMLVDVVLDLVKDLDRPEVLELGTGTGAIAIAIKKNKTNADLIASDISHAALQVAQANARQHAVAIDFIQSDWYQNVNASMRFDVIVSNPPYIAEMDPYLGQGDLPAEPRQALCSGPCGLEALQAIIFGAQTCLKPSGWLVLEHGYDQQQAVTELLVKTGFNTITTQKDFNDLARMSLAQCAQ